MEEIKQKLEELEARIRIIETALLAAGDDEMDVIERQHQEFAAKVRAGRE